jgi:glutamate dehydrogenase
LDENRKSLLIKAIDQETAKFQEIYLFLQVEMPPEFFEEVDHDDILLIVHNLMGFHHQLYFSQIQLKQKAIVLTLNTPDADLSILKSYALFGIKTYETYVSKKPLKDTTTELRIAVIHFTEFSDSHLKEIDQRFLKALPDRTKDKMLEMFSRAQTRDSCQYEIETIEDEGKGRDPSLQIILAWRNTPKHNFMYRIARVVNRNHLKLTHMRATYYNPYGKQNILLMVLNLEGENRSESASLPDFLRELTTLKYFSSFDLIDENLVSKKLISGAQGNLLRAMSQFIHQILVHLDQNLYTLESIEEALSYQKELICLICKAFSYKFDPNEHNFEKYLKLRKEILSDIKKLDTGQEIDDARRKNVLYQAMNFVHHTLKTNFYRLNYTALSFRLDPKYLDDIPFDRFQKFPTLPYGIFFMKGMHFFGFHIRFKDLARGGLRTVFPERLEQVTSERNNVFTECYNLAYTQHLKNKDIPEGGAKGVIFLIPYQRLESESIILKKELKESGLSENEIETTLNQFNDEQSLEYLHQSQRSYIESFLTLINCEQDGTLKAKRIVDYFKKPEYIYLGPDEHMHDEMIDWIANISLKYGYKPGSCFISGKPETGINHKEFGVTSRGVNVYMEEVLSYLNIDPKNDPFTIKMTGGPSGDVAGNQILNLYRFYPNTAKLLALTDGSGTIYDKEGLDLNLLSDLFHKKESIHAYPVTALSEGGFLLNRMRRQENTAFSTQTLCTKRVNGKLIEEWLSGSDMNALFRNNVHQTKTDLFIPAGGRPKTLNLKNVHEFLDSTGQPTAKAIIEGANLYLTREARTFLEKLGCLIIKDSSANKTGVICSSFEVLSGLTLGDQLFLENKTKLVEEILERLSLSAKKEAHLLLKTHKETGRYLTEISDEISLKINQYKDQLLAYFEEVSLKKEVKEEMMKPFFAYCLGVLRDKYKERLLTELPDNHIKAIIACHLAAGIVYKKGLSWSPSIVEILPVLLVD